MQRIGQTAQRLRFFFSFGETDFLTVRLLPEAGGLGEQRTLRAVARRS